MKIVYTSCPACSSATITQVLSAIDHTVSGKEFEIYECTTCSLRFTQGVPSIDEISSYYQSDSYISHSDTKEGLISSLYHRIRIMTLRSKRGLIEKKTGVRRGRLLDIGSGTGAFLHTMHIAQWEVNGLEPDSNAREKGKELYDLDMESSEELFKLEPSSYDAITMWHVLEHVHQLHDYLDQLKKLLKPNGRIFIAVPNYTSYDAKIYGSHWAAYDVPRHLYHFSPGAMTGLLTRHGLNLKSVQPMWFDSFYVSMLSEKYKTGKNNILRAIWNGNLSNWKAIWNRKRCSSLIYIIAKD